MVLSGWGFQRLPVGSRRSYRGRRRRWKLSGRALREEKGKATVMNPVEEGEGELRSSIAWRAINGPLAKPFKPDDKEKGFARTKVLLKKNKLKSNDIAILFSDETLFRLEGEGMTNGRGLRDGDVVHVGKE